MLLSALTAGGFEEVGSTEVLVIKSVVAEEGAAEVGLLAVTPAVAELCVAGGSLVTPGTRG